MTEAIFLQALGWAIFNSIWQLALLWVIYQFVLVIFPSANAALRSRIASGLLLGGFSWFIYTLVLGLRDKATLAYLFSAETDQGSVLGTINTAIQYALPYASIIYMALLILPLLRFTRNYRYVQVIRSNGLHKIAPEWRIFTDRIVAQMGIKTKVQIWVSEWVNSPVTIGFLKPVILIPIAAINHLSPSQLEAVILHEISHIQKMDYLVNLLMNFIRVILYFNPFANAFIRIVETEREKSCDEMVMQFQYPGHEYASALLTLEKLNCPNQILVLAAIGKNDLLSRVERIMGVQKKQKLDTRRAMAIFIGLVSIICVNALTIVAKQENIKSDIIYGNNPASVNAGNLALVSENPAQIITDAKRQSAAPVTTEKAIPEQEKPVPPAMIPPADNAFRTAGFQMPLIADAVLSKSQEIQVKQAMAASKKVLENVQLMQMEKNLADAFSEEEKASLKNEWRSEMNKFDWSKLENKLRVAYEKVDWNKVNLQLNTAIRQIQMDSLANVYNRAMYELNMVQRQLNEDSLPGIPDTDITLKMICEKQQMIRKALEQLRPSPKKTVKL